MEISNLTLGRENKRIFQEKLLLPWVRDVCQKKGQKKKKKREKKKKGINQSKIEEKWRKIEKKKKRGSLDQTMSEQCAELSKEKNIKEEQ